MFLYTVGNRCIPLEIDGIVNVIEKSELIKALYNIQLVGSINGVSGKKKSQNLLTNINNETNFSD